MSFKCLSQYIVPELSSGGSYFSSLVILHCRSLHCVTPNHWHHSRIKSYGQLCKDVMFVLTWHFTA